MAFKKYIKLSIILERFIHAVDYGNPRNFFMSGNKFHLNNEAPVSLISVHYLNNYRKQHCLKLSMLCKGMAEGRFVLTLP